MWDPDAYLGYLDLRSRPFFDLVSRIDERSPRRVVDLGCGPGNLTLTLSRRWPSAALEAMDSSEEMVNAARSRGIEARLGDVNEWSPRPDTDVVVCNAVLHWVPEHAEVLRRWVRELSAGAWIAVQLPRNFSEPSHELLRELAAEPKWQRALGTAVQLDGSEVLDALHYAELFAAEGCQVDAWETTYVQRLTGKDPVLDWISGTALRPIKDALEPELWDRFRAQLAPRLRKAYPPRSDGTTWFPFRRVFATARVR
ncbi:MAG: trans-aconitate 2-methyltransferase [Actinophytocola sp.]|nr:trans-aconitate 2-methyltransferase [Actinophytocola sp.]